MKTTYTKQDFNYDLPAGRIATHPLTPREAAKMLYWDGAAHDHDFYQLIDFFDEDDVLVLNDTKVIPARLHTVRARAEQEGQVQIELLLHHPLAGQTHVWEAFAKPAKRCHEGDKLYLVDGTALTVLGRENELVTVQFPESVPDVIALLDIVGEVPLPPYIDRPNGVEADDVEDYQTVFAAHPGSVAAPTAGLHLTDSLLAHLHAKGVQIHFVTLHVGAGTFQPVKVDDLSTHQMHHEWCTLDNDTALALATAQKEGKRITAVGTTTLRTLESAAAANKGQIAPFTGETDLFITPGYAFKVVNRLITNFHLPESTLLMLVAAFIGFDEMHALYAHAIAHDYRFFSFGDGCLLERADD